MGIYVDRPRWEREHGLSGHMLGDSIEELHEMAAKLELPSSNFLPFAVVPHYQLPACCHEQAIANGAIHLERTEFVKVAERISRSLQTDRMAQAMLHGVRDPVPKIRKHRRRRKKKAAASKQISLL